MNADSFNYTLRVSEIGPDGKHVTLVANRQECRDIAVRLGLDGLTSLKASLHVTIDSDRAVKVNGRVEAEVQQTCVVTLEPVTGIVAEDIDLDLVPAGKEATPSTSKLVGDDDAPDIYTGGTIDLGATAVEFLALAIDPYPRVPGVSFPGHVEDAPDSAENPFSALKQWGKTGHH